MTGRSTIKINFCKFLCFFAFIGCFLVKVIHRLHRFHRFLALLEIFIAGEDFYEEKGGKINAKLYSLFVDN